MRLSLLLSSIIFLSSSPIYSVGEDTLNSSVEHKVGRHIVVELSECTIPTEDLDWNILLWYAAYKSGAEILDVMSHTFSGGGWTGLVLLGESHISVHTWPEYNYVALDFFSCGDRVDMIITIEFFINFFDAQRVDYRVLNRGY